ncbi:MAG: hypothetical protein IPJ34_02720 [Myxococcales bacterium]|nr:hypothetical protein [Myxococcales bacterium]
MVRSSLYLGLALASGCGRCNESSTNAPPAPTPSVVVASSAAPSVSAAPSASSPYAPKGTPVPTELHGPLLYVLENASAQDSLELVDVKADGAGPARKILERPHGELVGGALSRDGKTVAYARTVTMADKTEATVNTVGVDGKDDKRVAVCDHVCEIVGFDAKGALWFLERGAGDFPTIHRFAGKPEPAWAGGFSACNASHVVLSPDGQRILVTLDDSFGWPECIESKFQGVYVMPVDAPRLDTSHPLLPFSKSKTSKGMNLNFAEAGFSSDGTRLELDVSGVGEDEADSGSVVDLPWSCKLDGTDPRHAALPPRWSFVVVEEGKAQRGVARLEGKDTLPIPVIGPAKTIAWLTSSGRTRGAAGATGG